MAATHATGSTTAPPHPVHGLSKAEYYAPAEGKRGVALLRTLHAIIEEGHEPLSYVRARSEMFQHVADLDDDNVVEELYSGRRMSGVKGLTTATEQGLTAEHVWPQSEGATREARTDLHHLRPADGALNRHRSNLPYGVVKSAVWASPAVEGVDELSLVGRDKDGVKVFTPRASMRGDLARDQFYFFTRYQADRPDNYSLKNFRISLPTLVRWHEEDPVDEGERARNEAIFQLQGNRNPYVDHPEFVDRVRFNAQLLTRRPISDD